MTSFAPYSEGITISILGNVLHEPCLTRDMRLLKRKRRTRRRRIPIITATIGRSRRGYDVVGFISGSVFTSTSSARVSSPGHQGWTIDSRNLPGRLQSFVRANSRPPKPDAKTTTPQPPPFRSVRVSPFHLQYCIEYGGNVQLKAPWTSLAID